MTTIEERTTRLEADVENEREWRRELNSKVDKIDTKMNWMIGIAFTSVIGVAIALVRLFGA